MTPPVRLLHGDCLEVMRSLPDCSIDAILCDLPYGITDCCWDAVIPFKPLWAAYKRLCKPNAPISLHACDPFSAALICSNARAWKQTLIWHKNVASNFLNANRQHLRIHEDVILFSFGSPPYFPQKTPGKPYKRKRNGRHETGDVYKAIIMRTDTRNTSGNRYPTTILKFNRETGLHPTQKPVALLEYLIRTYTRPGDTVLDNTVGSGSTGVACIKTGRNIIGIELDPKYFRLAQKRIAETAARAQDPMTNGSVEPAATRS